MMVQTIYWGFEIEPKLSRVTSNFMYIVSVTASGVGTSTEYRLNLIWFIGDIQVWNHTAPDEMLLMKFPSNRIKDIDVQSSLLYTQLLSRQSYQSQIKILSADQSSLNVIDTITIREADQKYKLPKVCLWHLLKFH